MTHDIFKMKETAIVKIRKKLSVPTDDKSFVSVITTFLNAEKFIAESVQSVLQQTCSNWELLLVDDGSIDRSTEIAKAFERQYSPKVRYICHENRQNLGISASRNLGIQMSKGAYIAFLDADDIWPPDKLEIQIKEFRQNPTAGMVYGKHRYWYSWDKASKQSHADYIQDHMVRADRIINPPDLIILLLRQIATMPGICNIMFKRRVLEKVSGFENSFRTFYEDQVIISKVCLSFPVYVSNAIVAFYRQHSHSMCAEMGKTKAWRIESDKYLDWFQSHISEHKFCNRDVWAAWRFAVLLNKHQWLRRSKKIFRRIAWNFKFKK